MDKQPKEGHNSSTEGDRTGEGETLDLGLTLEQASSLILILNWYATMGCILPSMVDKAIKEDDHELAKKLKSSIEINRQVLVDAEYIYKELAQIMIELEKPKPAIIKPNWKG